MLGISVKSLRQQNARDNPSWHLENDPFFSPSPGKICLGFFVFGDIIILGKNYLSVNPEAVG